MSTISSISSKTTIDTQQVLDVRDKSIKNKLEQLIKDRSLFPCIELDTARVPSQHDTIFIRDWCVLTPKGLQLFPRLVTENKIVLQTKLKAIVLCFGSLSSHEINFGTGFLNPYQPVALKQAQDLNRPYLLMRSPIEGGNCFLFTSEGTVKALVGCHSLALTIATLADYFEGEGAEALEKLKESISLPSDLAIMMARNIDISKYRMPFVKQQQRINTSQDDEIASMPDNYFSNEKYYIESLTAPLSESDKSEEYLADIIAWEAKIQLARQVIADDLGVSLDNIAFVPQTLFHLDMELFVHPNGKTVFIDEGCNPKAIQAIETIGCKVITLKGITNINSSAINCMNGLVFPTSSGFVFVSNGCYPHESKKYQFLENFKKELQKKDPSCEDVLFVDDLQLTVDRFGGGLRCATSGHINSTNATPIDLIESYLIDEFPADKTRREILYSVLRFN